MIFHPLSPSAELPKAMNDPFSYSPHPLCRIAATALQQTLPALMAAHPDERGKMFGVLVVEWRGVLGYLQAYSGQIEGGYPYQDDFVPPVYDYLSPTGYFKCHERAISSLNVRIAELQQLLSQSHWQHAVPILDRQRQRVLDAWRLRMAQAKAQRDARRPCADAQTLSEMTRESQFFKAELRRIRRRWDLVLGEVTRRVALHQQKIDTLKQRRRQASDQLQTWLFSQFMMRNGRGETRSLADIFARHDPLRPYLTPPAGTGECCEPKLLQYAYLHDMIPLNMAMFWWGESPAGEIRHHLQYYPACQGKCAPTLAWMLQGVEVEHAAPVQSTGQLETVYEDAHLVVVCKPAGMLSVPGRHGLPSVADILRSRYPEATGPMMVHRLDRDTSGLLVVAKTQEAYVHLQRQFAAHTVCKRYVALLEPLAVSDADIPNRPSEGTVCLPLCADADDRPRQKVDYEVGKEAITRYEWLAPDLICLYPLTGRTHQLRIHCAHALGLARPILGDPLYGHAADRLYLHAASITFVHPATGSTMTFTREPDFFKVKK